MTGTIKNALYTAISSVSSLYAALAREIKSRILVYHNVEVKEIPAFTKQLQILVSEYDEFLTVRELITKVGNNNISNKKYCCITFDDGFETIYTNALPLLEDMGIKCTVFINHNLLMKSMVQDAHSLEEFCAQRFPRIYSKGLTCNALSEVQIDTMIRKGHEFGAHTCTHIPVSELSDMQFDSELREQVNYFSERFEYSLEGFAYPYGRRRDINGSSVNILINNGFKYGCTGISNFLTKNMVLYRLPRTSISLNRSEREFILRLKGKSDFIDKVLGEWR